MENISMSFSISYFTPLLPIKGIIWKTQFILKGLQSQKKKFTAAEYDPKSLFSTIDKPRL